MVPRRTGPPPNAERTMSQTPRSKHPAPLARGRAKRVFKVGELATSVGSSYVWEALKSPFRSADKREQSLLDTHIRNAMRIVESSKELKGAFMKLVQMLSMRDDILPGEALKVLSVVQSQVPPMDYAEIRAQVEARARQGARPALPLLRRGRLRRRLARPGAPRRAEERRGGGGQGPVPGRRGDRPAGPQEHQGTAAGVHAASAAT